MSSDIRFFRDRNGKSIAYSVLGKGPLVVCPGWWVSNVEADWREPEFRRFFSLVGEGLTLVRYDRLGMGLSDDVSGEVSLEHEVDILEDLVAELNADYYSVLALSSGGPLALGLAARDATRIRRICFVNSYACGADIVGREIQDAILGVVKAHWGLGSEALTKLFMPDANAAALEAIARQQRAAASAENAVLFLKFAYDVDASAYLQNCFVPTLVIHRDSDRAVPADLGRKLARELPNAKLIILEGRNHVVWFDSDDIALAARTFLANDSSVVSPTTPSTQMATQLDWKHKQLMIDGNAIDLTPLEFSTMAELIAADGSVLTRDDLLASVWNLHFDGATNRVDVMIRNLRKKLGRYAPSIKTSVGHGYRFIGWRKQGE